jgi:Fibronectin type III domain
MAQTMLPVRLVQMIRATTRQSVAFRLVVLSLLLVTGSIVTGCGSEEGGDGSSVPTGSASASLAWDPVAGVFGYIVHYGTQSPGSPGSCAYAQSVFSTTPEATVSDLAEGMTYFFAVSAYNGLESACSVEVMTVTNSV